MAGGGLVAVLSGGALETFEVAGGVRDLGGESSQSGRAASSPLTFASAARWLAAFSITS
jgi:hypothetical protein